MVEFSEPRYAVTGNLELAYASAGDGDRTLVRVSALGPTLDSMISGADWFFRRLGSFARIILFDRRGQGLSSRSFGFGTVEDRMDDIRVVMDANEVDRAVLAADHDSVCLALLFAATYPDRIEALVLTSVSAPRTRWAPDYPIGLPNDMLDRYIAWIGSVWGTGRVFAGFNAELAKPNLAAAARGERAVCTPSIAEEHFRLANEMDVREILPAVQVPTLIIHGVDELIPIAWARYLAERLSDATLIEAPGKGILVPPEEASPLVDAIEEFVTGARPRPAVSVDRVLATVLFVDIATSTERLVELGDSRWSALVVEFRQRVRTELEHHRGREINYRGDDVLAIFDGSTRAVRCAEAIASAAAELGVTVRAGAHTGEIELQGDDIAGIAVNTCARICALATPGEILVTSTLRDLVQGSGLKFTPRGSHELKGIPAKQELFAVSS
jgi:class 3 adenylate cyclase